MKENSKKLTSDTVEAGWCDETVWVAMYKDWKKWSFDKQDWVD